MKRKFARIVIYMEISYTNTKMISIADFFCYGGCHGENSSDRNTGF